MAINFPNIKAPAYPFGAKIEDVSLQSKMEDGTVVSRARFTRARETFILNWSALPDADYSLLRTFFKTTVKGGSESFNWTHPTVSGDPYSGQTFTARFVAGDINFSNTAPGIWSGQITIQEV